MRDLAQDDQEALSERLILFAGRRGSPQGSHNSDYLPDCPYLLSSYPFVLLTSHKGTSRLATDCMKNATNRRILDWPQ